MNLEVKTFDQLDLTELYRILELRNEVFIVEQNCTYQDIDGEDQAAYHIILKKNGRIQGYARFLPGVDLALGRIIIDKESRGLGWGRDLLAFALDYGFDSLGGDIIYIEAQSHLTHFYEDLGFRRISKDFSLDGILHCRMMVKKLNRERL